MPKRLYILFILLSISTTSMAQFDEPINDDGFGGGGIDRRNQENSGGNNKEIPVGLKVWQVDERFGDRRNAEPDTLSPMFMNTIFTTGLRGEYNTTGNASTEFSSTDRATDSSFSPNPTIFSSSDRRISTSPTRSRPSPTLLTTLAATA